MLLSLAVLAASASPAPAQAPRDPIARDLTIRNQELQAQQMIDQQRSVAVQNDLNRLDAQVQSQQRMQSLQAERGPTLAPLDSDVRPPPLNMGSYASIPDSALAASNARVREASQNRR